MTRHLILALTLAGVSGPFVSARQQPTGPPAVQVTGTGLIAGQIVDARGAGVSGAVVTLNGGLQQIALATQATVLPGGPKATLTNSDGHFVFFDLPAGAYSIDASKPGFLPGAFGRRRFGGPAQSLELAGGERKGQVRIPIWEYAAITGRVVDESGEPAVGVQVRALNLALAGGSRRWTIGAMVATDDRGWYRLDAIEPGEYLVVVASTQITLPAPVLTALAADVSGGPTSPIAQLVRSVPLGSTSLTGSTSVGEWAWLSNSRSSAVVPAASSGPAVVYPTTFHPNARSTADAQSITVGSGEERSGIDIHLQLVPATTVRGTVLGPDGPVGGLPIRLLANFADSLNVDALEAAASVTDAAGHFAFVGVPVGPYMLRATASPGSAIGMSSASSAFTGLWALQPVAVTSAGPSDVVVTLRPGVTLRGRLEFRGNSPRPGPEIIAKLFARLEALDPYTPRSQGAYQVNFTRDGEFVFTNVPPGRYVVGYAAFVTERLAMPRWETLGAELDGKDVSYRPFTITSDLSDIMVVLTDQPTELTGTVRGASGQIDPNAAVLLFTAERDLWTNPAGFTRRMRMVRASEAGTYLIRGIPSGDYFLATIPEDDAGNWQDPSVLDRLSRGALRIAIAPDDKKTQDLTTRSVR